MTAALLHDFDGEGRLVERQRVVRIIDDRHPDLVRVLVEGEDSPRWIDRERIGAEPTDRPAIVEGRHVPYDRLTDAKRAEIRRRVELGQSYTTIAAALGVNCKSVYNTIKASRK